MIILIPPLQRSYLTLFLFNIVFRHSFVIESDSDSGRGGGVLVVIVVASRNCRILQVIIITVTGP